VANFGKSKHERFKFDSTERLGRKRTIFNQGVAVAALSGDLGAPGAQAFNIPINGPYGNLGFPRELLGSRRGWECAKNLEEAQQAIGTGHSLTDKNWQEGSIE